jgi:hypothetical protein
MGSLRCCILQRDYRKVKQAKQGKEYCLTNQNTSIMNAFQINDKEGVAIPLNHLDQEAAAFWGVEVEARHYASPTPWAINWYDIIGFYIANQGNYTSGWRNVAISIFSCMLEGIPVDMKEKETVAILPINEVMVTVEKKVEAMQPYVALINHWAAKGYQPVVVK